MNKIKKSILLFVTPVMAMALIFALVACGDKDNKDNQPSNSDEDDALTYYYNNFVNDEFIEHWVTYGLDFIEENKGMTCQITLAAGDFDDDLMEMKAEGMIIMAGIYYWDRDEDTNYSCVYFFEDEKTAEKYVLSSEEEGGTVYRKREGNAVYEETIEGSINKIKNATVTLSPAYQKKIDFVKKAFKEIKDIKNLSFVIVGGFSDSTMFSLTARHKKGNLTSTYAIYPTDDESYSDEDGLRYTYETGQWYTADSYIDDTIEEGYSYYKLIDKPGFKYEFIKDENGNPTDKISVYSYLYNDASGINLFIPSTIDGYTVERVDTAWEMHNNGRVVDLFDKNTKSIKFPKTMKEFYAYSLYTPNLTKVEIEDGNQYFTVEGNCLISNDEKELILAAEGAVVPSYVKSIGWGSCKALTSINIPIGVEQINWNAFGLKITKIEYDGTMIQFKEIYQDSSYPCDIVCSNGTIKAGSDV